jgi:hypothetical protein
LDKDGKMGGGPISPVGDRQVVSGISVQVSDGHAVRPRIPWGINSRLKPALGPLVKDSEEIRQSLPAQDNDIAQSIVIDVSGFEIFISIMDDGKGNRRA